MSQDVNKELLPCPFCGQQPRVLGEQAKCNNESCILENIWFYIDSWGTRPQAQDSGEVEITEPHPNNILSRFCKLHEITEQELEKYVDRIENAFSSLEIDVIRVSTYEPLPGKLTDILKDLGITYKIWVPHSIADCIMLWGVDNVPQELPNYMQLLRKIPSKHDALTQQEINLLYENI